MSSPKKRILCVDDDSDTCQMLSVFLTHSGFEVVSAQSAAEGLRLAQTERFDLFLLDLWFKENRKIELFREIRQFNTQTPIVIYSADARATTHDYLNNSQVQAFLVKPKGFDDLIETIEKLVDAKIESAG